VAVFAHSAIAANAPIREVTSQASVSTGMTIPAFYKGYIYWAGGEPLRIYAPDGHLVYIPEPPGRVEALATDDDNTVALAWNAERFGFINLHDASGALVRTIPTGRYLATHLAFGEDHSLWTLGYQVKADHPAMRDESAYMIVRKFLPSGQQAGAYLPRSLFPPGLPPGEQTWQASNCITVAHDRVGLWVNSGPGGTMTEWVELDLDGNLTGRWRLDPFSHELRVALTSDGRAFVQHLSNVDSNTRALTYRVLTLNRSSSSWQPIPTAPSGRLVGAEGETLIFADFGMVPIHLRWYPHP
jgi:hypothetical protein